jgi:hypothetical protein
MRDVDTLATRRDCALRLGQMVQAHASQLLALVLTPCPRVPRTDRAQCDREQAV